MKNRFSEEVTGILRRSGWYPGRVAEKKLVEDWIAMIRGDGFEIFPTALNIISEFGGINIKKQKEIGIDVARGTISFLAENIVGYPLDMYEGEDIELFGSRIYPLGERDGGHGLIVISEKGETYTMFDRVYFEGKTFDEALENILLGKFTKNPGNLHPNIIVCGDECGA